MKSEKETSVDFHVQQTVKNIKENWDKGIKTTEYHPPDDIYDEWKIELENVLLDDFHAEFCWSKELNDPIFYTVRMYKHEIKL
jgi:hypothetical protein